MINKDYANRNRKKRNTETKRKIWGAIIGSAAFLGLMFHINNADLDEKAEGSLLEQKASNPSVIVVNGIPEPAYWDNNHVPNLDQMPKETQGIQTTEYIEPAQISQISLADEYKERFEISIKDALHKFRGKQTSVYLQSGVKKSYTDSDLKLLAREIYEEEGLPSHWDLNSYKHMIDIESDWKIDAQSEADARGLGQLTYIGWIQSGIDGDFDKDAYDPEKNLRASMRYIHWAAGFNAKNCPGYKKFSADKKQDYDLMIYNAGSGTADRNGFNLKKMPKQTQRHIQKHRIRRNLARNK